MTQQQRIQKLQARMDDLLAGTAKALPGKQLSEESNRLFAPYFPDDMHRASALAALCMKTADRIGGLDGIEAAVDKLYECLGQVPRGMVEHTARLFLTHYRPASFCRCAALRNASREWSRLLRKLRHRDLRVKRRDVSFTGKKHVDHL